MDNIILELNNIRKSFYGIQALKNVSFNLLKGHTLGLIGENGAGKSTLMNIIGGVIKPDAGSMKLNGKDYYPRNPSDATRSGIAFIHQELNLFTNLSIWENMYIDNFPRVGRSPLIDKKKIFSKTKQILESIGLSISPDTLVEKLSPGERQIVEIAKALNIDAQIIIFDEPTTSLTTREVERLFELIGRLKKDGKSIIYISHILEDILRLADEIVVLRDGQVTGKGKKEDFDINRMISLMVGRDIEQLYPQRNTKPSEELALQVKNVSKSGIVHNINFNLYKGEVLGLFGLMGSGRTELARILFGLDPFDEGQILVEGKPVKFLSPDKCIKQNMAFVTENRRDEGLFMDLSIAENIGMVVCNNFARSWFRILDKKRMYKAVEDIVDILKIKSGDMEKFTPKSLSGGNQQKVVIAKWLMKKPSILIVDEPTRGIDVGAKYEMYNIINDLASEGKSILVISSEIEELIGICDRILVMDKGEVVGEFNKPNFRKENILGTAFRQNIAYTKEERTSIA